MEIETPSALAARRSAWYWVLAELFLTCPDPVSMARWRGSLCIDGDARADDPASSLRVEIAELSALLPAAGDATETRRLAVEYTRLFAAIRASYSPPPPYESMHRKAAERTDLIVAVDQSYAEAGLAPIDHAAPSDHLGVELRFMALLCHAESAAWQDGRPGEARRALGRQREFLDRHLLTWAPGYLDLVQTEAQHPFYRRLATLARQTMVEDEASVEIRRITPAIASA